MTHPNTAVSFFDLLGLDPDEPWVEARFEAALKSKQNEWSRNRSMGVGAKKAEAEDRYKLVPTIKAELSDPAKRQAHADRARTERAAGRQQRANELEEHLKMYTSRGYLLEAEAADLLKKYAGILGEAAVKQQLATVRIERRPEHAKESSPIDSSLAKEIQRDLGRVGVRTLYEFLLQDPRPIGEKEPTARLLAIAEDIYRETSNAAVKTTEVSLRATLAGHCRHQFSSEGERARYDATLQEARFTHILNKADMAAAIAKTLTAPQVQLLLEEAGRTGIDPEKTHERIKAQARDRGWAIEVPSLTDQRWCGCGELNRANAERCGACGQPLKVRCPSCQRETPSETASCTNCGFPVGRRFRVRDLIDEARTLTEAGNIAQARLRIAEAIAQWPGHGQDELSKALDVLKERNAAAFGDLERALQDVRRLVGSRAYYTARTRLLSLTRQGLDDPEFNELCSRVDKAIADAERRLDDLHKQRLPPEDSAVTCVRILDACTDCEAARQVLAQHPPAAPSHLQASLQHQVVSLTWPRSSSAEVRYVVVRKSKARPQGPNDGDRVALVDDLRCEDASPEAGVDLHYAVFADRRGVASRTAARIEAPLIVLHEVEHVRAQIGDGEIRLDWTPPPNVHRVFATRTPAGAVRTGDDTPRLDSIDARQLVDRSALNDHEYRYTVRCEFLRTDGQIVVSRGAEIVATPQKRPASVEPFAIAPVENASGRALRLSWTPPLKGEVWILNSPDLPLCGNQAIPAHELSRLGEPSVASGASMLAPWQEGGVRYYTPVVVLGETAYVGSAHRYVHVEDVRRLQAQNLGDRVRLTWEWPVACTEVHLITSSVAWPLDDQHNLRPAATMVPVARAEYDRHGSYDVRPSTDGDLYVIVQGVTRAGAESILAPGARCRVRLQSRVRLEYELHQPALWRKSVDLAIRIDRATELPPFRIVRKRGQLPQDRDDGECVLRRTGKTSVDGQIRLQLTDGHSDGRAFGKLFLESDQDYEWITVLHPDRAKLKI